MEEDEVVETEAEKEVEQEPEPDYALDDNGEIQYGEDGEPILVEAEEAVSNTNSEDEDTPAQVYLPTGEGAASKRLKEALADPELSALLEAAMEEKVERKLQAFGVTQAAYNTAAAEAPELFRKYGSKINMVLATFPEAERHTRKAVDIATVLATVEHKAGTPEFASELLKVAQKFNNRGAAAPKAPKAPIAAASRPPSPSSGARSQVTSTRDSQIKLIMKDAGVTRAEAEDLMKGGR